MKLTNQYLRNLVCCGGVVLLSACASGPATDSRDSAEAWSLVQPYHEQIAGMGGGSIVGSVGVPRNQEPELASRALVMALQDQQLSIVEPALGLDRIIPANTPWSTDIAPLPDETIDAYNDTHSSLASGRRYGISYSGLHDTSGNEFRYKISARLYERGSMSDWSQKDDDEYFGSFFIDILAEDISQELQPGEEPD